MPGYERIYKVSNLGRVFSYYTMRTVCVYQTRGPVSRRRVALYDRKGGRKDFLVAPLVLRAFVGEPPAGHGAVHKSRDGLDDRLCNLEWRSKYKRNLSSPLDADKVLQIRTRLLAGERQCDLAGAFGVSRTSICRIAANKVWADVVPSPTVRAA